MLEKKESVSAIWFCIFSAARRWPAIGLLFSFTSVIIVVQVRASKLSSSVYYHPQLFAYPVTSLHWWQTASMTFPPGPASLPYAFNHPASILFADVLSPLYWMWILPIAYLFNRTAMLSVYLLLSTPPVPSDNAGFFSSSSQMTQKSLPLPSLWIC